MFHQWESEEAGMRCEEECGGRKRRASTISDDQAKRTDPNARCRTFFSAVGAHSMSGAKGEGEREELPQDGRGGMAGSGNSLGLHVLAWRERNVSGLLVPEKT